MSLALIPASDLARRASEMQLLSLAVPKSSNGISTVLSDEQGRFLGHDPR